MITTAMTDSGAKEWVTLRVPKADRETCKEYRPDGKTYADCLVAGTQALAACERLQFADVDELLTAAGTDHTEDVELGDGYEEIADNIGSALADAGVSLTYDDVKAANKAALREVLPEGALRE